jgi:hypothetical protein
MATLPQVTSLSQITPFCSTVNPIKATNFSSLTNIDDIYNEIRVEENGGIFASLRKSLQLLFLR